MLIQALWCGVLGDVVSMLIRIFHSVAICV